MEHEEIRNDELKEIKTEHYAMEILKQQSDKSKAEIRGRNVGIIALTVALVVVTITLAVNNHKLSVINYQNDKEWRELFASYDYYTQDGGGYNNINTGTQGDVNNGSESENKEK